MISERFDFSSLNSADRLTLIGELWDSVEETVSNSPLTNEQMTEVNRRLVAYRNGEMGGMSWEEFSIKHNIA